VRLYVALNLYTTPNLSKINWLIKMIRNIIAFSNIHRESQQKNVI